MHYHLEIIIPQTDDIENAVEQIMEPFSEHLSPEEAGYIPSFWDWYVIGGRFAGDKLIAGLDSSQLQAFYDEFNKRKFTVSAVMCGKQDISPAEQIPDVDALWAEYFPEYTGRACPLFGHANAQYTNNCLYGDVLRIKDLSEETTAARTMIAMPDSKTGNYNVVNMYQTSTWNGINFEETSWDGYVVSAVEQHNAKLQNYGEEFKNEATVTDDWIAVTVDYHC